LASTQACDLMKQNMPWVFLAPVYDASERLTDDQKSNARAGKTFHLVPLTADWTKPGFWVADLRLEVPVEKSFLSDKKVLTAFVDEVDYSRLAERLAIVRMRPAIHDHVIDNFITPFFLEVQKTNGTAQIGVREFRASVAGGVGSFLVTLFAVADTTLTQQTQTAIQTAFINTNAIASKRNISLVGPIFTALKDMTAEEYLVSHSIEGSAS
jgi:hypothetical protein